MPYTAWSGLHRHAKGNAKSGGLSTEPPDVLAAKLLEAGWRDTDLTVSGKLVGRIVTVKATGKSAWKPVTE